MSIGMTYEQYWYGDTHMVRAFYRAEKLRQEQKDAEAWMIGSYVAEAITATVGAVFRKKGSQPETYPDLPRLMKKRMEEEEERRRSEEKAEKERLLALAWMTNFVQAGKNWGKNKKQEG